MPSPMEVAEVLPTVERASGLSFVDVMKGEGLVGRAISNLVDRSPLNGIAKQLDDYGINWIGVDRAGQGVERMSAANTSLVSQKGDSLLLKPLHDTDRLIFGTRAFGTGQAEAFNVHKTMATAVHSEGVLSNGSEIAANTARYVNFMKVRGIESASTLDGFQRDAKVMRGLFGDADPARAISAKYGHLFSSRPDFTHSHYLRQKPGTFGPAENPIRTDVADIRRYKNGTSEIWPVQRLGDKATDVPLRYDARFRQMT